MGAARAVAFKKALIALLTLPVLAAIALGGLSLVMSLPNDQILENLTEKPEILTARRASNGRVIDADTECIGASIGLYTSEKAKGLSPLERAVLAESLYGCEPLLRWAETGATNASRDYFRYWHGHLLISRPLLSVLPYNDVRGLMFVLCLGATGVFLWRIGTDFSPRLALAFAIPLVILNSLGFWVVVTKAVSWMLLILAPLALSRRTGAELPFLIFFGIGVFTAMFDFLTIPAAILALSLTVWGLYEVRQSREFAVRHLIFLSSFWFVGYVGFWLAKIAIAAHMLGPEVWGDAFGSVTDRLRGESEYVSSFLPGTALFENLGALKTLWGAIFIGYLGALATRRNWRIDALRLGKSALPFLLLAIGPLCWMELLSNHSQIHAAFTHLNFLSLLILVGAVLLGQVSYFLPSEKRS